MLKHSKNAYILIKDDFKNEKNSVIHIFDDKSAYILTPRV